MLNFLKLLVSWDTLKYAFPALQPSPVAKEVVRLLISDRDNWERSSHHLTHRGTGVAIWTANEVYGLHLEQEDGPRVDLNHRDRRAIYDAAKWEEFDRDEIKWKLGACAR